MDKGMGVGGPLTGVMAGGGGGYQEYLPDRLPSGMGRRWVCGEWLKSMLSVWAQWAGPGWQTPKVLPPTSVSHPQAPLPISHGSVFSGASVVSGFFLTQSCL